MLPLRVCEVSIRSELHIVEIGEEPRLCVQVKNCCLNPCARLALCVKAINLRPRTTVHFYFTEQFSCYLEVPLASLIGRICSGIIWSQYYSEIASSQIRSVHTASWSSCAYKKFLRRILQY